MGDMMNKNKLKNKYIITAAIAAVIVVVFIVGVFFFYNPKATVEGEKINENFTFLLEEESEEIDSFDSYDAQSVFMDEIMNMYKKKKYTISDPLIIVNPFYISPQTALILFDTTKKEKVTITIKGKHGDDIVKTFESSKTHIIPVYGLYGEYENTVILETESGKKKTHKVKVEKQNASGNATVFTNKIKNSNGEFYFTTSAYGASTLAYDNYGETRWYLRTGYSKGLTMLSNGNLLLSDDSLGPDQTSTGGVVEVDMMGYVRKVYKLDGGYHHDGFELPNGNLLILTTDVTTESFADYVVELDRKTGKVVKDWNLKSICDAIDKTVSSFYPTWGWINSITYDEKNSDLILSVRNMNSVVSVDYEKETINWILGDKKYWTDKYDKYLIKGIGEDFIYPLGQHSVNITEEGYLSIFNNGYDAYNEEEQSCKKFKNSASYAMVYDLNLTNMTASVVWKFGGHDYFSYALSSYTYASDGHTVFNSGWHFPTETIYDDPSCTQFGNDSYDAFIVEFDKNRDVVVEMHLIESKFEVVKADIYNLAKESVNGSSKKILNNYSAKDAEVYHTTDQEYEVLDAEEAVKYADNYKLSFSFAVNSGHFISNVIPLKNDVINVVFINLQGKAYRFKLKGEKDESVAILDITDIPKGKYYIYLELNGRYYNTLSHVNF